MKMVIAYVRHEAFEPIRQELLDAGFPSLSVTDVKGSGRQKGITEHYRGAEIAIHLRPKLKIECVVESAEAEQVTETILRHARSGQVGDGKIFVLPVESAVRIRTGETGEKVLQAHESQGGARVMAATDEIQAVNGRPAVGDLLSRVESENIEFVRFWFTDILGRLKSFAVGKDELEDAFDGGMGFDGSSITGFNRIEESDMIAMPDPSTFRTLPWRGPEHKVGRVFCDVLTPGGGPYEGDPRFAMKRALARAKDMGFDQYNLGPELEFFLFKDDQGTEVLDKGGYFDLTTLDAASDFRRDVVFTLRELGIPVEYTHHEVGPSQHEIDMRFADGLTMSDNTMTYRIAVKEVALQYGFYATFMPKPLFGENGSGMHVHQSLFTPDGKNAFFDGDDESFLSDTAKAFIAGQLRHARELSALFAPSVNSYKRLVPGYEAPVYIAWSRRNRSALVRVPVYHPGKEKATRAEIRCPDPSCNPYLAFAGLLHAGLDGIEKGYDLPDPVDRNLYDLTEQERQAMGVYHLPETLGEAIEEMAASEVVERALGEHIFSRYIDLKRAEWADYRVQVTPWELDTYLSVT